MEKNNKLIRQIVKKLNAPKEDPVQEFAAVIGKPDGTVLTGTDGIIWVTKWNGESLQVVNRREPNTAGTHVVVGIDPSMPARLQVLRTRYVFGALAGSGYALPPSVGAHAETHRIGGGDTDFIEIARFMPLLVWPKGGQVVAVYGGVIQIYDGSWVQVSNQDLDLTASQPASGAVWAVIEVRNTGTLRVTVSDVVQGKGQLVTANLPIVEGIPFVAIKLYNQTNIQRDPAGINDFLDLRHFVARSTPSVYHNLLPDIDGGGDYLGYLEAYHLTQYEWEALVKGLPADGYHIHDAGFITYSPIDLTDWDYLADPGDVSDALDQLASRTTALEAVPPGAWDGDITDIAVTSSADIGAAIVDDDQGIIYDTSATAWVRFAWSRVKTYIQALTDTLYIAITGNVSQANLEALVDGSDADSYHTHDTLVSKQMLLGNCLNTTVPLSSTYYAIPGTVIALQTLAYNTEITEACNISGLRFNISNTQPLSGSLVVTVQKNNVDTGITITIPADSPTGVYTESSPQTVAFVAGDLLIIKIQNNATATSAPVTRHSLLATFT